MSNIEEIVKLPEALASHLGNMSVRYQGWFECDPADEESSALLCEVVWNRCHYSCRLLLPLQSIEFDEQLLEDCADLLSQSVAHEAEFEWRTQYLEKIETLVQKASVRLYKKLIKSKKLPKGLRPKTTPRSVI